MSVVKVVFCQVQVSATGRSLVQWSPTEFVCIIECDQIQQTCKPTMSSRNSSRLRNKERKKKKKRKKKERNASSKTAAFYFPLSS
jgi:hypothetical protein